MGIVEELKRLIDDFKFFEIVNEYQQGVYYRRGNVAEKRIRKSSMNQKLLDVLLDNSTLAIH